MSHRLKYLMSFVIVILQFAICRPSWSAEPTLARLSFWVPQDKIQGFETVYRNQVVPVLKQHGLKASSHTVDTVAPGVFSRLFEFASPRAVWDKKAVLEKDDGWVALLNKLGSLLGNASSDGLVRHRFGVYAAPKSEGIKTKAQEHPAGWSIYTGSDGFPLDSVVNIVQDKEGYLWFAGTGGVARFDGISWKTFTTKDGLTRNWVWPMVLDREGNLWCGTGDTEGNGAGVSRYDGQTWKTFTTDDGLVDDRVISICEDRDGNLWFGTYGGVSKFDGQTWTTFTTDDGLANNFILRIYQDRNGHIWFSGGSIFGRQGKGVTRYDPNKNTWTTFTKADGLVSDEVSDVIQDAKGDFWFLTIDRGLSRFTPQSETPWQSFTISDGLLSNALSGLIEDKEGNIWVGSHLGVSVFDGEEWKTLAVEDGLGSDSIWCIYEDAEGHIWIGGEAGKITKYSPALTTLTGVSEQLSAVGRTLVWVFTDREGRLWLGNKNGAHCFDGEMFTSYTTDNGLADNDVGSVVQDDRGVFWFGTMDGGMSRYDPSVADGDFAWRTYTTEDGLASNKVRNLIQDRDGNLWFTCRARSRVLGVGLGIVRFDGQTFRVFTTEDGLESKNIFNVFQGREGNLWIGTGQGINRLSSEFVSAHTVPDDAWQHISLPGDTGFQLVLNIMQDLEGALWIGTWGNGVMRNDGTNMRQFTQKDGLVSNNVYQIIQDSRKQMWIGTTRGVSRFDGKTFGSVTKKDGLAGDYIRSLYGDTKGTIWVGSDGGLTRFRRQQAWPPPVFIDAVVADRRYEETAEVKVASDVGLMTFEFRAISFKTRPEAMQYRYRLVGYEDEWKTTNTRQVTYEDVPTGNYTFEVIAVDRDLVYSEKPATLGLVVHLPYDRVLLVSLLGIAIVLIGWQTVRVVRRDRRLRMANRELVDARDMAEQANHAKSRFLANMSHEIRTPMNAILGYAQILQRDKTLSQHQEGAIATIHRSGEHLLKLINDVLDISKIEAGRMELQPSDFDLKSLVNNISVMFELRCEQKRIGWQVETPQGDRIPVHGDEAKLSQVLINLLGNAVKFTRDGRILLRVTASKKHVYHFEVIDTGPGVSATDQDLIFEAFGQSEVGMTTGGGTGLGLSISHRLIELMGGQLELISPFPPNEKKGRNESGVPSLQGDLGGDGANFHFTITLPPAQASVQASPTGEWALVSRLAEGHTVSALVVDDVLENRDVLSRLLADIDVDVRLAESGEIALGLIAEEKPDIVLMDIRMPGGMDGPEVAENIWEIYGRDAMKVVAVSASTLEHEQQEIMASGFDDFLPKPFRTDQVYGCLAKHLGVEFEYADDGVEAVEESLDFSGLTLPEELHTKLLEAAELYSVTEMDAYFNEVGELGSEHQKLADHLRALRRKHDIEGIIEIVEEIRHGS